MNIGRSNIILFSIEYYLCRYRYFIPTLYIYYRNYYNVYDVYVYVIYNHTGWL